MVNLSFNQMCVLSAVANEDRYGIQIIETVKEESGIKLILGSLYNILHKLEKEGLVTSYFGEATAERGGNRRKYYKISAKGETVLNEAQLGLINLWGGASFLKKLLPNLKLFFSKQWRFGAMMLFMMLISNMPIYAASLSETLSQLIFAPIFVFFFFLIIFFLASIKWKNLKNFIENAKINDSEKFKGKLTKEAEREIPREVEETLAVARLLLEALIVFAIIIAVIEKIKKVTSSDRVATAAVGIILYLFLSRKKISLKKNNQEQNQTTSKIIKYFSYTLPSAKREEVVGDLNETVALMRKDKVKSVVICIALSWQMTRILFAMVSVKLSDFVREKGKEQSK